MHSEKITANERAPILERIPDQLKSCVVLRTGGPDGKAPLTRGWSQLTESETLSDDAEICGLLIKQPLVVIDVDVKPSKNKDGRPTIAKIEEKCGPLPRTLLARRGEGWHEFYHDPTGRLRKVSKDGVDILTTSGTGGGSNCIAPGSMYPDGVPRLITDDVPIARLTPEQVDAILEVMGRPAEPAPRTAHKDMDWEPVKPDELEYEARDRGQQMYFSGAPRFEDGGGLHRYVILLQNAGPGFRIGKERTRENFIAHYNPRLEPADRWNFDNPEHAAKWDEAWDRAKGLKMSEASGVDEHWPLYRMSVGLAAKAEQIEAERKAAAVQARGVPITPDAPHEYTFDPCNVVREIQYVEAEDGNKKAKKPFKPDIDEIVFDLNTEDDWAGVFRYNEFDNKIYARRPPCELKAEKGSARLMDSDVTAIRVWFLHKKHMSADKADIQSAVDMLANRHRFHPIRDWLDALSAGTTRHLDSLAAVLFGDERPIAQKYVRNQLIASVARIMDPGCQVDTVLTLVGPAGGERKSTTIRELYTVPGCPMTFRDSMPDLRDNLKVGQAVEGFWAIELAELEAVRRADYATTKATLTRRVETYSPKYVAGEITRPRAFVFWASSNPEDFLPGADPAFRRRFWPVRLAKKADLAWLAEHRAEIWSEAVTAYKSGEQWWFEDESQADEGRQEFIADDPMIQTVREAVAALTRGKENVEGRVFLTAKDIYTKAYTTYSTGYSQEPRPPKGHEVSPIHAAMKDLKYEKKKIDGNWGYWVPCNRLTPQRVADIEPADKVKEMAREDYTATKGTEDGFCDWWDSVEGLEYRQAAGAQAS